ncbi:MAG: hypothetical protein FWE88_06145 [Phycisphaerae bacterium]|nr:hypothetical protein [Phycisphaerae bacterium]
MDRFRYFLACFAVAAVFPVLADEAAPKADGLTGVVDPFDVADQRAKFFKVSGKTGELDAKAFEADRKAGGGLVMPFETWETAIAFDKNKNGTLDWFEFEAYRQAMRKAVLAACDKDKDNKLTGDERAAALKLLTENKLVIKPDDKPAGVRPPQAGAGDGGSIAATSQPTSRPTSQPGPMDFAKVFREFAGKGVTREDNAAVALFEAIGLPYGEPGSALNHNGDIIDQTARAQVAELLGIVDNEKSLPHFYELGDEMETVLAGPWATSDAPNTARRLAELSDTLDAAAKALQRPQWFVPYAVADRPDLPTMLMPNFSQYRSLARYFIARGFASAGEGNGLDAWRDIQSASRLGALVGKDPSVIGMLVSGAVTSQTDGATQRLAMLTADKAVLQAMLEDVSNRPAVDMGRAMEGERLSWNDMLAGVMRKPGENNWFYTELGWSRALKSEPGMDRILEAARQADSEAVLRAYNRSFEERNAIMRIADRQAMIAASDAFEKRQAEAKEKLRENPPEMNASAQEKTQWVADMAATTITLEAKRMREFTDRFEQSRRITTVAVALELYKLDKGQYPEQLDALSPAYLPAVPTDLFSGKAMMYKAHDKTYDLYSVGPNGKDDGSDLRFVSEAMRMRAEAKAKAEKESQ